MARNPEFSDLAECPLVEDDIGEESDMCRAPLPLRKRWSAKAGVLGTLLIGLVVAATSRVYSAKKAGIVSWRVADSVGLAKDLPESAPSPCAGDGGECIDSQCCVPGGSDGLQCYKKTDGWAQCSASCEPGVHEPEKEGTWDETGTFVKAQWSCEKAGPRSKPGCDTFTDETTSACPTEYCMLKGDSCTPKCDTYGDSDGCWKSNSCMWEADKCMEACWTFDSHSSCQPTDKCTWTGKACQLGWWLFGDHDSCDQKLGYKWNGTCVPDECSMVGEDCSKTKCCSTDRGASGMTCFKKDKYWATCKETCDKSDKWSCEANGKRAKYSAGCAWAGNDCSIDKLCCNKGFSCAVKDELFTGCVLTKATSTWVAKNVEMPAGWDGTIVGPGRDEFQHPQAGPDEKHIGTTLYCFMAFLPDSYEQNLVDLAEKNQASIYGCDKHDLYHTWQSAAAGWDTGETTLQNTDVFVKIWSQVQERGDYIHYDWTVKVDPDCVFAADRLRSHIESYNLPDWASVYIKNNGQDPGLGNNGFLGAIEILSKKAVSVYLDNQQGCVDAMGFDAGEDGYLKACMDGIGIGFVFDVDIFFPDNGAGACMNAARVAFHPLKDPKKWEHCWQILLGKAEF